MISETNKEAIYTQNAPNPVGPYSQAVVAGPFIFISGQLGIDMSTGVLYPAIQEQAQAALKNIEALMVEAGGCMDDVVKTTVLLADMEDFREVNRVYADFFREPFPARAAFQVAKLPLNALVEIEAVARLKER